MTEEERRDVPLASSLLATAVKEINEKDSAGAVANIKMHIKLIQVNDDKIAKLQESNKDLLRKVTELCAAGGLSVERFQEK